MAEAEAASPSRPSLRKRKAPSVSVVEEMAGLRLCLDPRRHAPGYEGTGYRGVTEDFWPSGFKARKPFTMVHAGKYHGRFCDEGGGRPPLCAPRERTRAADADAAERAARRRSRRRTRRRCRRHRRRRAGTGAGCGDASVAAACHDVAAAAGGAPARRGRSLPLGRLQSAAALGEPLPPSFRRPKPGGGGGAAAARPRRSARRAGGASAAGRVRGAPRATAGAAARAATCPRLAAADEEEDMRAPRVRRARAPRRCRRVVLDGRRRGGG